MKLSEDLRSEIYSSLEPLHPETVVPLLAVTPWGQPTEESDIDLYVVTQDDFVPATWRQRRGIVGTISQDRILDLRMRYPVDLMVHTKPMYQEFVERKSSFARQIISEGTRLL